VFVYGDKGKPSIAKEQNSPGLRFNVSHSGGLGLIAVTCNREIGVDVETRQKVVDYMAIAKRFFSAREHRGLAQLPGESRPTAFLRCWTRKESYVKALGKGLSCSLNSFSVSVSPDLTDDALVETECTSIHYVSDIALPDEGFASMTIEAEQRPRCCWTYNY
jgi:4'-phosphopantetheinyl transferase